MCTFISKDGKKRHRHKIHRVRFCRRPWHWIYFYLFLCVSMGIYSGNKSEWNVNEWKFLHWQFFPSIYITLINQCQSHADCNWCVCVCTLTHFLCFHNFFFCASLDFYSSITCTLLPPVIMPVSFLFIFRWNLAVIV